MTGRGEGRLGWRRAFVVGGSEGIGLEIARQLAAAGTDVVVLSRSQTKLDAARTVIGRCTTATLDVTEADGTRRVLDDLARDAVPDLVVNTAGFARAAWLTEVADDDARAMVETNYLGTVHVCRAVVPHLVAAGRGTIVTTSSMAGVTGVPGYTLYGATKFAVRGFSEALRRELHPTGVRVTVLCPPNTRTPGFDEENRTKPPEVLALEEKVRTLDPADVAAALLRALPRNPPLVLADRSSRTAGLAVRLAPRLVERSLRRR